MSNPSNTSPSNPAIPTTEQLSEARTKQWHQQGEALLTMENLRSWINASGLVLFAPRPQIAAPAPSLVEATLGAQNPTPTLSETSAARSLLARLVAEGLAVPLNLLGSPSGVVGETPDFVASTAVFSYVFTMRGDKGWKQPPATGGAVKVSHLALAIHEALSRLGPQTASALSTEVGKEVTEAAVLRALAELWTHLRVLPLYQPDDRPTIWELTGARFTKQIKAGANAGQPTALSALISLYLGQAVVATEDEIESFLSPVAPRSRIRDVVHALMAARQLETLAVEGRTVLHVAGELPLFVAKALPEADAASVGDGGPSIAVATQNDTDETADRITKYVPKPRKIGTGYLAKAKPARFGSKPDGAGFASKAGFKPRSGPAPDRERRPFSKAKSSDRGGFDKPWDEEKAVRRAAAAKPSEVNETGEQAVPDSGEAASQRLYKPRTEGGFERRAKASFGNKPSFGSKPAFGSKPSFGGKPSFRSEGRPPRRDFAPRPDSASGDARPPRKTFSKPGTFGRKREGFAGKPSFGGDSRPPRREFAPRPDRGEKGPSDRPRRTEGSDFAPRKSFSARPSGGAGFEKRPGFSKDRPAGNPREGQDRFTKTDSGKRVYRKFDAPRERADRPARPFSSDRPARPFSSDRPARPEGSSGYAGKSPRGFSERRSPSGSAGAGKPGGGFAKKSGGDFAPRRPSGKPGGGKKPYSKPGGGFADKSTSTFAKFAGNKKPFGNRPPARKYKPKEGESA